MRRDQVVYIRAYTEAELRAMPPMVPKQFADNALNCEICGKPLFPKEVELKVRAHFPCVFRAAFGDGPF